MPVNVPPAAEREPLNVPPAALKLPENVPPAADRFPLKVPVAALRVPLKNAFPFVSILNCLALNAPALDNVIPVLVKSLFACLVPEYIESPSIFQAAIEPDLAVILSTFQTPSVPHLIAPPASWPEPSLLSFQ